MKLIQIKSVWCLIQIDSLAIKYRLNSLGGLYGRYILNFEFNIEQ